MRVVLADDSILLREGVARLLAEAGFDVVGQAADADELLEQVAAHQNGDKLVISKEFPDVTFRYRIEGDTIMFDPLNIPAGCTTFPCGWSIAVAYPGKKWERVR